MPRTDYSVPPDMVSPREQWVLAAPEGYVPKWFKHGEGWNYGKVFMDPKQGLSLMKESPRFLIVALRRDGNLLHEAIANKIYLEGRMSGG